MGSDVDRLWQDKQERLFLIFLAACCALLLALGVLGGLVQAQGVRDAVLNREAQLVSGMLEAGLSEEETAEILSGAETTDEGEALLLRAGRTRESLALLYPQARRAAGRSALFPERSAPCARQRK